MAVHLLRRDPAGRRLRPGGRTGDEPGAPGVQERQGQDFTGEENKFCLQKLCRILFKNILDCGN